MKSLESNPKKSENDIVESENRVPNTGIVDYDIISISSNIGHAINYDINLNLKSESMKINRRKTLGLEYGALALVTMWFYSGQNFWNFILILLIVELSVFAFKLIIGYFNKK